MKLFTYLSICFFFPFLNSAYYAQTWGKNTFGQFINEALDVEVDNQGNSYITGYVTGQTAFSNTELVTSALGNGDVYVAKYSSSGQFLWKKTFGGNYSDRAYDLAIGSDQNIVITGQFFGTIQFGATTLTSTNFSKDIFVVKLDPNGIPLWAFKEGGEMAENAYGITVDNQNNVLLTGQFQGNSILQSQSFSSAIDPNTNLPSFDFFISKYDANGQAVWIKTGFAQYEDRGLAVACDAQNNVFMTGQFSDTLLFDGQNYFNIAYNVGFLAKFDPQGNLQFFNKMRGGMVLPYDLEVDSQNEVIVIGDFLGNMNYQNGTTISSITNPYSKQIFALKVANSGTYLWNYTLGSENTLSARAVSIDANRDVYLTGFFECRLSQASDSANAYYNSVGFEDPYLLKLTNNGTLSYLKHFGGQKDDKGQGIAIKGIDDPVICGSYTRSLNFSFDTYNQNVSTPNNSNYSLIGNLNYQNNSNWKYYLIGDNTTNSFITNTVNGFSGNYNYYDSLPQNHIVGFVENEVEDTLHWCYQDTLRYFSKTHPQYGPLYSYLWNTGATTSFLPVNTTGNYGAVVQRLDECSFQSDSIVVIMEPIPPLPLLTDNLGINLNHPGVHYNDYHFCAPDSVILNFSVLPAGVSFGLYRNANLFSTSYGPTTISQEGYYTVVTQNQYCTNVGDFDFELDYIQNYNPIDLGISIQEMSYSQDSISICYGDTLHFLGIDLLTNPSGNHVQIPELVQNFQYGFSGGSLVSQGVKVRRFQRFFTSGWYTIDLDVTTGYHNLCALDTTHNSTSRQIYITVNPLPSWTNTLIGDNLLCENGLVHIVATNPNPAFNWYGNGIIWNNNNDSIAVNASGVFQYKGWLTDTVFGCSKFFNWSKTITLKTTFTPITDPADGIICPYDTVEMSMPTNYLSYQWIGPNGDSLSNLYNCFGEDQGFYYCHVLDNENCWITSPPVELKEYATPNLSVLPDNYLCLGETADLVIDYDGSPVFTWINPIGQTADEITVSQAGVYAVSMQQCGIETIQSIEIFDASFTATISVSDSVLCFGESAVILGSIPNVSYEWNNNDVSGQSYVVSETGNYFAELTNEWGCNTTTNAVTVEDVAASVLPIMNDTIACPGSPVSLSNPSTFVSNWYALDSTLLFTGNVFMLDSISSDTTFLIAYESQECNEVFSSVSINLIEGNQQYEINGDTVFCSNTSGVFSVNTNGESVLWTFGTWTSSANPCTIPATMMDSSQTLFCTISTPCSSVILEKPIVVNNQNPFSLVENSVVLCAGESELVFSNNGYDSIVWTGSFGQVSTDSLLLASTLNSQAIIAYAVDSNNCQTVNDTLQLIVSQGNYAISENLGSLCFGNNGTLQVNGQNIDSISWQTPVGNEFSSTLFIPFDSIHEGNYVVSIWDNNGCLYHDSLAIQFNSSISETAQTDLIFGDSLFCSNEDALFSVEAGTNTVLWNVNGWTSSDNPVNIPYSVLVNNTTISVSLMNNCANIIASDTLIILPISSITPNTDSLTLCSNIETNLSILENYSSITWTSNFDTEETDSFLIAGNNGSQIISVQAVDSNFCVTQTAQIVVFVPTGSVEIYYDLASGCIGDSGQMIATATAIDSLAWNSPQGNSGILFFPFELNQANEVEYILSGWDTFGCVYSDTAILNFNELPVFDLGTDSMYCINDLFNYIVPTDSNVYTWQTFGGQTTIPIIENQTLLLTATSPQGCVFSDSIFVHAIDCGNALPNVITPNGDSNNDVFFIDDALVFRNNSLTIVNRWGNSVLSETGYSNNFSGENLAEGVYFYTFKRDKNDASSPEIKGFLTIIR